MVWQQDRLSTRESDQGCGQRPIEICINELVLSRTPHPVFVGQQAHRWNAPNLKLGIGFSKQRIGPLLGRGVHRIVPSIPSLSPTPHCVVREGSTHGCEATTDVNHPPVLVKDKDGHVAAVCVEPACESTIQVGAPTIHTAIAQMSAVPVTCCDKVHRMHVLSGKFNFHGGAFSVFIRAHTKHPVGVFSPTPNFTGLGLSAHTCPR